MFDRNVLVVILTDISDQIEASYLKQMSKRTNTVVASMTHELRTPLNSIIGLMECVLDKMEKTSEIVKEYLLPANQSAYVLLNQINNILDSSKMKFKTLKISRQKVCIRNIFSNVLKLLEQKAKLKMIDLQMEVEKNIPKFIISDSQRL